MTASPIFFADPAELRAWLAANHATKRELFVGRWKVHTGKPTLSFEQLVREALCFGWIDGQVRSLEADSYQHRITPRKPTSRWSAVNARHIEELIAAGLMQEAGLRAWAARDTSVAPYSTSDRPDTLDPPWDARLREHPAAAAFWDGLPASYRKRCAFWLADAKRDATKEQRFGELLAACAAGERLARHS